MLARYRTNDIPQIPYSVPRLKYQIPIHMLELEDDMALAQCDY